MSFIASNNDVDNTGDSEVVLKSPTGTDLLGQLTMAASLPVVIASNQTAIPISAASLPLPTGAATAALQTQPGVDIGDVTINNASGAAAVNIQDGGNTITVDGTVTVTQGTNPWVISATSLPLPTGAATAANQTTEITSLGTVNTNLGIINANLTNGNQIVKGMPTAVGQTTMANSMAVTLASNQSTISVNTEGTKATYSAAFTGLVPAATPTDVFTIIGSATKTIRITSIRFTMSTTAGSGILTNLTIVKRSTADTAGTSTTATNVPHDSTNAAATAVVRGYTANPTLGTAVGTMRAIRYDGTPAAIPSQETFLEFGTRPSQTIVLRGVAEQLCLNLGGTTITGGVIDCSVEWTEE